MIDVIDFIDGKGIIISRVFYKHENSIETAIGGTINTAGECISLVGFGGFDTHATGKINGITREGDTIKIDCAFAIVELTEISVKNFESSKFMILGEEATHEWVEDGQMWYFNTTSGSYYPHIGGDYELLFATPSGELHSIACAKSERVGLTD